MREKYKEFYETDAWFEHVMNEIEQYVLDIPDGDISLDEKKCLENEVIYLTESFRKIKETKQYKDFRKEQAQMVLNLYDALGQKEWENESIALAKKEMYEKVLPSVLSSEKISDLASIYRILKNVISFDDEIPLFYSSLNKDIRTTYTINEIMKYRVSERLVEPKPSKFETTFIDFYNLIAPIIYNKEVEMSSNLIHIANELVIRNWVIPKYNKEGYSIEYSFASSINLHMFSNALVKKFDELSDKDIEQFIENLDKSDLSEFYIYLEDMSERSLERFVKQILKRILDENIKDESHYPHLFTYKTSSKTLIKKIIYEFGNDFIQGENGEEKKVIFKDFLERSEIRRMECSYNDFNEYVSKIIIEKAINDNKNLFNADEEIKTRTISFNKDEVKNSLGDAYIEVTELLNTDLLTATINGNKILYSFMHENIENPTREELVDLTNNLIFKAFEFLSYSKVKENTSKRLGKLHELRDTMRADIKQVVLKSMLKDKEEVSERKSKKI